MTRRTAADPDSDAPATDRPMALSEHLDELRKRLLRSVLYVIVLAAFSYYYRDALTALVLSPIHDLIQTTSLQMIIIDPAEGFFTTMKVVIFWGLFFAAPLMLLEMWRFIASGLYPHERRGVQMYAPFSYLLFVSGILFSQLALVPVMLMFLFDFTTQTGAGMGIDILNRPRYAAVVTLVLTMSMIMGMLFQLPVLMLGAQKIGVVSWRVFSGYRRHFIMGSLILAAVLTPTGDPISLAITMAPVLVLFELGILLCRVVERKTAEPEQKDA